ncbi:PREDICTED: uncharacterized protein LOC108802391 [Nanorana parkeri]|uniref:uncharacterized protein LOC108802391 n=1 Tax=Nanorana parkeri TaxID=125878 RepID=UPI000854F33A|nr:PREDICTED: uncharacterized protein LOC108802391 [Nanorana parkeri]
MERPLLLENLPQVTFDDAAIYFSEEQWQNLEDFQKKIYKELIKEIYETMLALGYRIPKPEIVSRIERGEEPCIDSSKKPKLEGSQAEGSKDAEPTIKVERESPEASVHFPPSEISSSQERGGGVQCPRCGTCCNNQCGVGYQWNAQGMYPGPPVDTNHRKPYVTPSPTYFNGSPISPGYANRADGMPHPPSPMGYSNMGMVPLSPHYPVYRNVGDPHTTFSFPERPQNPMFGNFEVNQPTQMGPPGSHLAAQTSNDPQFQFQGVKRQILVCVDRFPVDLHSLTCNAQSARENWSSGWEKLHYDSTVFVIWPLLHMFYPVAECHSALKGPSTLKRLFHFR